MGYLHIESTEMLTAWLPQLLDDGIDIRAMYQDSATLMSYIETEFSRICATPYFMPLLSSIDHKTGASVTAFREQLKGQ
jgi:hypothetical protein